SEVRGLFGSSFMVARQYAVSSASVVPGNFVAKSARMLSAASYRASAACARAAASTDGQARTGAGVELVRVKLPHAVAACAATSVATSVIRRTRIMRRAGRRAAVKLGAR